jgi:signal transduction histidine kinase/ligand-binding sensor domain-containing protein/CheY-like chemotaxis protein/HPt (histidine-containing phosphotransfer) domain-containing protein
VSIPTHTSARLAPRLAAALCLACAALAARASDAPLVLEHLTTADGLPQGTVFATLQDSQGFVWLATEDGLVRYDGHELLRYAYSRNTPRGLPGNYIEAIAEDAHGDLWLGIKDRGVARWQRTTDSFVVYRHDPKDPASLTSNAVHTLAVDADNRVWVGTSDSGVDVLEPASGRIEHLRHDPKDPSSLVDDRVNTVSLDRTGTLWVGTEAGLDRWQPEHHGFLHLHALDGRPVSRVLLDSTGTLWVATFGAGLHHLDGEGNLLESLHHDAADPTSIASDVMHTVLEDQASHLWVGTAAGLELLNRATGQFSHYHHEPSDADSLRDSFIMSLYQDQAGLLWIGTRSGGVSRWNPRSWELGGHRPQWLQDKLVTAFADGPDGRVWIAARGGGLALYDDDSGRATSIDVITGRKNAIGDQSVMSLRQDRHGMLWIGTFASGVRKLFPDGRLEAIGVKPGDARALSAAGIMTIFESRDGRIWIGTHGGGANVVDPVSGLVHQLPYGAAVPGATSSPNVTAFAQDASGNLWLGTDGGGLDLARADGTVISVFRHDPRNPASLPADTVYALAVDAHDRLWVATDGGGLALVQGSAAAPEAIRFKVLSREEGLPSDTVYGLLTDSAGHVWLSGDAGLTRYDPEDDGIKTYHREHGLQGEEFNFGAYYRLRDGRLCFGGPGGFNIFDPARLTGNHQPPHVALTRVEVLGVPAPGPKPYWLLDRIDLGYRATILSLDFGALDFASPGRNRLAYRMTGLTDRWLDLGSQRRVTLTNIESGDHVLEVRAANSDSIWSGTPLRLTIHRDPAPWKSWWAYICYALAAIGVIAYRVRLQRLKFQQVLAARQRLESEVALRTHELTESNRQLGEAVRAKSDFLDRMSHELRTPMNGVVGMTELLARTPLSSTQTRLTETIRSSARVLLQIVNDLLDLSKINAGKIALEQLPFDLGQVLEECASLFAGAAQAKGIELIVSPPLREHCSLRGDALRVRQIVMNLIGNAVKFTAQGEVLVRADVRAAGPEAASLEISVSDTGIGMDEATIGRIFEPFTQADESTSRRFGGSGLGLAICRELAELMGGSISVESRPQVGSTFRVRLELPAGPALPLAQALPARRVRILSRRPALAESLTRTVRGLGLTVLADGDSSGDGPEELLLVDASSQRDYLEAHVGGGHAPRRPHVVIATAAELDSLDLTALDPRAVVLKPVQRGALYDALAAASGSGAAAAPAAAAGVPGMAPLAAHVLLVEDEAVNAAVAQGYLSALGCTSVWVKDGAEAVARNAAERFDLIFMDLSMPVMDGFATTALIRQRGGAAGRVPIIALTAHDAANYREACLKAGMDDMLTKPYTLEECARAVRRSSARSAPQPSVAPQPSGDPQPSGGRQPSAGPRAEPLASVDPAAVAGLRRLRGAGHPDLYSKLVELFEMSSSQSLSQLSAALDSGDLSAAAGVCHKLASSAANVGASAFARDVRTLERLCASGEAREARVLHQRLAAAYPALIAELSAVRLRASA